MQLLFLALLSFLTAYLVDPASAILIIAAFFGGKGIVSLVDNDRQQTVVIYGKLFLVGWVYMIICYRFMINHGYDWLLAYDTYSVFIPKTESFVFQGQGDLIETYRAILGDYNFFNREQYSYWVYSTTWAIIINAIGGDLYLGLQTSTLFIYPFVGVLVYKLLLQYGTDPSKAHRRALIICFFSIIFFYSSQILRDTHVLLLYLIAIYLAGRPRFSVITIVELLLTIFVTCGIRIESGLYLSLTLPIYMLLSVQRMRNRIYSMVVSLLLVFIFAFFEVRNSQNVMQIYDENYETYVEDVEQGSGVIARFQRVPIVGDLLSILYSASMPIPVWNRLDSSKDIDFGGKSYNIMNIPRMTAAFFNIFTYVYVFYWLVSGAIRKKTKGKITKQHKYQLLAGMLFLYLQSAVVSQRRLMGYYCVFYIFVFLILDNISTEDRKNINIVVAGTFLLLQIIGVTYFV